MGPGFGRPNPGPFARPPIVLSCGLHRRREQERRGGARGGTMRNYGIIGTLVAIILVIVILRLLGII